jgi:hypothetical protein
VRARSKGSLRLHDRTGRQRHAVLDDVLLHLAQLLAQSYGGRSGRVPHTSFLNSDDPLNTEDFKSVTTQLSAEWRNDCTLLAPEGPSSM